MMPDTTDTALATPRPKRHKIDVACETCRTRKIRCDGARPSRYLSLAVDSPLPLFMNNVKC